MKAEEILQILDEEFEVIHHDPPHLYQLGSYFYPSDARMTVFRSAECWAVFFEIVGYWAGRQEMRVDVRRYGNCFQTPSAHYEARPLELLDAHTDTPLDGSGSLDPRRFAVLWNGQRYPFTPSEADYAEAGVALDETRAAPEAHAAAQIVRYLCERLNHAFFLPEEDLRALLAQGWTADEPSQEETMALFLQTRDWRHPDLSQEERPSQVHGFQLLARALASGDISEWDHQDPASFNTNWRVYDWEEKAEEEQRVARENRQEQEWDALAAETRARIAEEADSETAGLIILPGGLEFPASDTSS